MHLHSGFLVREAGLRHRKRHIIRFPAERENLFILLRRLFPSEIASLDFAGGPVIGRVRAGPAHKTKNERQKPLVFVWCARRDLNACYVNQLSFDRLEKTGSVLGLTDLPPTCFWSKLFVEFVSRICR